MRYLNNQETQEIRGLAGGFVVTQLLVLLFAFMGVGTTQD
jgi:tetrahydromethanopterin S-methyltransferase subunit F